jgi:hypothetical protein
MAIRSDQTVSELNLLIANPKLVNRQSFKVRRTIRAEVNKFDASGSFLISERPDLVTAGAQLALTSLTV